MGSSAATLFVEMQSEAAIARTLERLVGLQEHVWLVVGGDRVKADLRSRAVQDRPAGRGAVPEVSALTVDEQAALRRRAARWRWPSITRSYRH